MGTTANFKVFQASAGAGKTFTLIKEYLKLCLANKGAVNNFRNILAITFTNAAANDMKAKIVKTLREIIDSEEVVPNSMEAILMEELGISDAELKSNAQSLMTRIMHDYSSFCVSTIDAFVQKLSRSFAHDLGLPSQYAVSIDTDEVSETITEQLGLRISDQDDFLTRLLVDFSNNQFDSQRSTALESQLSDFIAKLMTEKAYQKDEKNNIKNYTQYKQTIDFLNDKTRGFEQIMQKHLDDFARLERQYGLSDELYAYGKTGFISYVRKLSAKVYEQPSPRFIAVLEKRTCFSKEGEKQLGKAQIDTLNAALLPVLQSLKDCVVNGLGQFLFYKMQKDLLYLYALRAQIRMEFDALANEEEIVHISEFNKLLNTVMGDFSVPFVYERIGEHFRHVFVDEFQDTSVLQWQNLLPLIDNGLSSGNMSMVVGDGKQSIYRFRSGEVEQIVSLPEIYALPNDEREAAFLQFEQNLKDNFAFKNLDTNYRSFKNVVDFNNAFFEEAYKNLSSDLQKVYVAEKPGTDEGVSIYQKKAKTEEGLVQVELYDAENQPKYCFDRVEAIIRDLTDTKGYLYADIALLTRKSDYGSEMANYLNDKGIPVISQDSILLKSSDKVQLLVSTLRYLLYGDNETNVANVLFYWKLTRKQEPGFNGDVSQVFGEVKAVAKGEKAIEPLMGLGDAGVLQDALAKATCLYDLCSNLLHIFHFDTIHDAFLNYFMEEIFKFQSGIKEGIADFLSYWDKKQDKLAVMSVSGNAVKIMTIHKSKGLEFPVVIYPEAIIDLDEKLNASKAAEEWLRPEDLGFEAIPNLDKVLFKLDKNAINMGEKALEKVNKEKESNQLDNLNLLYVAFTRAVQRLYIIAKQGKSDKPNIIRDFLKDNDHQVPDNNALVYRFGSPDFMKPKEKQKEEKKELKTESVAGDWFSKIKLDSNPTMVWQSKSDKLLPREFGELVHGILSKIPTSSEMESVLLPYLTDGTIDTETADWIRDKFLQMSKHSQIGAAFDPSAKIKTECEILYRGVVCRLDRYAELSDVIYLIDYKTGKKDDEHHNQVRTYTNALKEMTEKEIRAYLVYLSEDTIDVEQVSVG